MSWLGRIPWSQGIKKRACRYLLQRYLGQFLEEKLTLDQLNVDLYNGTGRVTNVSLDVQVLPFSLFLSLWLKATKIRHSFVYDNLLKVNKNASVRILFLNFYATGPQRIGRAATTSAGVCRWLRSGNIF